VATAEPELDLVLQQALWQPARTVHTVRVTDTDMARGTMGHLATPITATDTTVARLVRTVTTVITDTTEQKALRPRASSLRWEAAVRYCHS
jgi:hypothetical protein